MKLGNEVWYFSALVMSVVGIIVNVAGAMVVISQKGVSNISNIPYVIVIGLVFIAQVLVLKSVIRSINELRCDSSDSPKQAANDREEEEEESEEEKQKTMRTLVEELKKETSSMKGCIGKNSSR